MYEYQDYSRHGRDNISLKKTAFTVTQSLFRCGKDFCLDTSIHGFNHIAAPGRHWIERLLWVLATAAAIWLTTEISLGQWQRYKQNPTVVTLEKDYRSWRYSLPAITACDKDRINPEKLAQVIKTYWSLDPEHEKYTYYKRFVEVVANSTLFHLEEFEEFKEDDSLNVDMFQVAVDVMPEFKVKATWSEGEPPQWTPVMTESGACYVANSLAIADSAIVDLNSNDTNHSPMTCKYSSLSCYVILEAVLLNVDFYVHSPYDVADVTAPPSTCIPTLNRATELSVMETGCGRGVRELSPQRRGCLYIDEPISAGKQVYSTNSCMRSCRNRLAINLCGCRPFYNFYEEGKPCTPAGMWCLSAHAQLLANSGGVKCACSLQCLNSIFRETSTEDQYWDRGPFGSRGSVRFKVQAPRTRYTREIVFNFQDLVVSFGGATGLFMGASFISFVEIIYFVLARVLRVFGEETKPVMSQETRPRIPYEAARISELSSILENQKKYDNILKTLY